MSCSSFIVKDAWNDVPSSDGNSMKSFPEGKDAAPFLTNRVIHR
jgi:hypothetical protein